MRQAWWYTPVISVLKRLKQEGSKFEANLDYIVKQSQTKKREGGRESKGNVLTYI
jgi:hypothetical protein